MKKSLNKIFLIFKIYFFISYYLLSLYNSSLSVTHDLISSIHFVFLQRAKGSATKMWFLPMLSATDWNESIWVKLFTLKMQWKLYNEAKSLKFH